MANRYDIVRIDFQASARGANAAIESLRQEAEKSNAELTKIRGNIDNALKAGAPDEVIAGMRAEAKAEERRYKQLTQAQNELIKGMRVLDQGVKMFNDGSLSQMNAAFQKAVNSAAKLAQSKMDAGTQSWREMGAIMQETEQNYARMQRDTEQLIQVIQNGGTVFRSTLEAEKKGIQELMGLVPYMGSEYQKLEGQLQVVTTKLDQMATAERQMKGEIVTANDARRVAYQLTEEGAAAAKREAEAAEQTIAASKERISVLEQERKTREDAARATAETVAKRNEDLAMQRDVIESIEKEIGKEDRKSKKKREAADAAKATAEESVKAVETEKAALEGLQTTTKAAEDEVKRLEGELSKLGTQKVQPKVEADTSEAKKELSDLQQQLQRIQKLKEEAQSKLDTIKTSVGELKNPVNHDDVKKALAEDRAAQQETIAKLDAKWDEYWKKQEANAKKFAEVLKKSVDDIDYKDFYEQVSGPNSELAKSWYRTQRRELYGIDYWGNDSENYRDLTLLRAGKRAGNLPTETQEELKVLEGLKRKYDEYAGAKTKALEATPKYNSTYEKIDKARNERLQEEAKLEVYYEKEIELKEQIAAKEKEITETRKQSVQPIQQQDAEIKDLTDDIKNLDGMISDLKKQRDALNASQQKSTAGMEGEAKSAQDLVKEMKRLNDEIEKQKGKLLKPEKEYQKSLQLATAAKKPEDRDRLIADAEKKLNEKTATTKAKIQELEKQLDQARESYKALTKEEDAAADAAGDETAAVQKLIQARDRLVALNEKSTFHESVSGERTITNPREAENFLLQQMTKLKSDAVGKTQGVVSKSNFDALRKAFGERYGMEKAEAEKWLKELAKPHGGIFTGGGEAGDGSYFFRLDAAQRVAYNKERFQASKELGSTSIISDPAETERAYQAALKQVGATEQQAAATSKLSGETQKQTQATKEQTQATQKQNEADKDKAALDSTIADLESRKQQAQEKLTQLQQQSAKAAAEQAEADKKETELKQQLAGAQQKLTEAQKAEEEQQKKVSDATAKANSDMEKSAKLESELANVKADKTAKLDEEKKKLGELEAATEKDIELNNKRQQELQETNDKIAEEGNIIREAQAKRAQAQTNNIKATEDAIRKLREENTAIDVNSKEWSDNAREIQHLEEALGKMKNQAALQMMTERMERVPQLSTAALTETKRFWEGMVVGAKRSSQELAEYEANLKTITEEEARRKEVQAERVIGDMGNFSDNEIKQAVQAFEQLRDVQKHGSDEWTYYNQRVQEGKKYLDEWAKVDSVIKFEEQMAKLPQLSDSALQETKKFWETMVAGADKGSSELREYEAHLEKVKQEESERRQLTLEQQAQRITNRPMFFSMSEKEIRQAIEATKELQQTVKMGDDEYDQYTQAIVRAEEHLKKYGLEAERTAAKLKETNAYYESQLNSGQISESALKAQESYWKRLIDDPKTASESLAHYHRNLEKVHELQEQMAQQEGTAAFDFFLNGKDRSASASEVDKQRKALIAYRDSLPAKDYPDTIKRINEFILRTGEAAKIASGQALSLKDALRIGSAAGGANFKGTVEQLTQAKKTLEELQQKAVKGGYAWRRMQEGIDNINLELRRTAFISKEVDAILKAPKGRSFNELKQAVEQGRAALQNMRRTTEEERKAFDELAKKVKEADIQMKALGGSSRGTASAFDKAWSRLKTYISLYVGAAVAMQKLTATMGDLMELSDKMGEVRKTTGFTADEVGHLSESLKKLDTRTAITGLLDLSVAAGQLGLKTQEDVQGFTEAANKLMVALPEMGREGATEMLKVALATGEIDKIRKQMETGLIEGSSATAVAMEKVGSTIDRLRATSAATAPAITDFVKRVGAVGAQSGISIDQVAALGSTVDALGMRVEMSATALSRMIPAIRNNAFDLAQVIGVTPDTIRNLFDTGRGMEVILMILQHIKDAGMDADSIEGMLGMGNMKEIMKELNQQGARAGIVFGGLSQNVDELRRQLGVASEAYEENIAIQQEYDKMNETTAAKWERLKNQLEEMFVGDEAQRFLGTIIDGLRGVVDIVANAFNSWLRYLVILYSAYKIGIGQAFMVQLPKAFGNLLTTSGTFFKTMLNGLGALAANMGIVTARTRAARIEWGKLDLATKQNIWGAVATAIAFAALKLVEWNRKIKESQKDIGRWAQEVFKSEQAVEKNFKAVDKANASLGESNKKLSQAKAALEKARKEMDGSKESADRLTKAEENLKKAEDDVRIANDAHRASIEQINKLYGSYLGFMLSEISSAAELANARELINAKLRETITLKRREAALGRLEESEGEGRDETYGALSQSLSGAIRKQVDIGGGKKGWVTDEKATADLLRQITKVAQDVNLSRQQAAEKIDQILINSGKSGDTWASWRAGVRNRALEYQKEYQKVQKKVRDIETQFDAEDELNREESQKLLDKQYREANKTYAEIEKRHANAQGEAKKKAAADLLKQSDSIQDMVNNAKNFYDLTNESEKTAYDKFVKDSQARIDGIESQRDALMKEAGKYYKPVKGSSAAASVGETSPWGTPQPADSLNYADMNPKQLVARRHQMEQFVNAIQTDTDIQSVLAEDKALKAAIEKGMSSDMRTVIEWYNTERLKIQDELKARHLTNEGNWLDPKKDRSGKTRTPASDGALAELERYYAWRKEMIEQARIEEGLTEEEFNRRIDVMEQEHMKKRSDLRVSFTTRDKKFIEGFHKWWASVEELEEIDWKLISDEWRAILLDAKNGDKQVKMNNMKAQKDLAAMERIVVKHLNTIDDILSKERPYDGITRNLQDNLTKMGILFADFDAEIRNRIAKGETDVSMDAADEVLTRTKRLTFLIKEAEHAYNITVTDLINSMRQEGFDAWADEIMKDDQLQQALMAQLRTAYDAVQDAIKKEASLIKKQAEIQWNDTAVGMNGQSQKQYFETLLAQLGLQEDAIKRANSLIGAGNASENVALRLAVKQMEIRLNMQAQYYALMRKVGEERARQLLLTAQQSKVESERLKAEAARLRAEGKAVEAEQKERDSAKKSAEAIQATADRNHVLRSLDLATTNEQKKLDEQRVAIANQLEEIQNNTYKSLKEWADLLTASLQSLFEASHAGDKEYYNELAKLNLTGKGGPGAGTYVVIDNEGTSDAKAHYEYLSERGALERQREIERQNAQAEAWRKVMDDINMKMSESITDWINASLQNASVDANTDALGANTEAIMRMTEAVSSRGGGGNAKLDLSMTGVEPSATPNFDETDPDTWPRAMRKRSGLPVDANPYDNTGGGAAETSVFLNPAGAGKFNEFYEQVASAAETSAERQIESFDNVGYALDQNFRNQVKTAKDSDSKIVASTQSAAAKMTQAMNLYGVAYQAMSNDNLSATQKFSMIAIQAAGQAAITALTTNGIEMVGETAVQTPSVLSKIMAQLGVPAGPIAFGAFTALLGGLMGLAMSKLTKAKSQIASVTGAGSIGAGRLSTGMLTYAEGNVNEFTDPSTLTPGRQYNVDAADGKTYRARYMGRRAKTHITNGPEFHLSGEKGREMIIDAGTTRQITMNERDIWHTIQTLSAGRRMPRRRLTGRGMAAFADGNVEDFEEMMSGYDVAANGTGGMSAEQSAALQASIDRQSDLLERALTEGIRGVFAVNGPDGLVNTYDKGKRQALRHGQQYP